MNRDRVAAWVGTLGDHPHAPVLKELLAEHDKATGAAQNAARELGAQVDLRVRTEGWLKTARDDAERLATWIIQHPSEHDPTEVLNLHDRSL